MVFVYIQLIFIVFSLCYVIIAMSVVYMAVRKVEKDAQKYTFARYTNSKKKDMEMSRRVMVQGVLYSAALASLCLTFILVFMNSASYTIYEVQVLAAILFPLQGFWNALIYKMPVIRQIVKNKCKSRQNISGSIQDSQNTSKASWLTRLSIIFWIRRRTSKESKGSSNQQVDIVKDESKKGDALEGGNDRVELLKVNTKQEEQILPVNASSELKSGNVMFKETKGDDSGAFSSSSLMLSCVEQEEGGESLSFALSRNSELEKEEQSQLECFSALEANTEGCDNVVNKDNHDSADDESYVDDYLKMMELG